MIRVRVQVLALVAALALALAATAAAGVRAPATRDAGSPVAAATANVKRLSNLANLELHSFLHRAPALSRPNFLAFDLDPGPGTDIVQCCQVGFWLKAIFDAAGLKCFPKTSGSKGLQIYVPLNTPTSYEDTKPFAHALARLLEDQHRELVVSDMKKELRKGKVLVDWSQNDQHKTTIAVYSLRAREHPTVSTPVKWEEVEHMLKKKDASLLVFEAGQVLKRVEKDGDLFEPLLTLKQKLPNSAEDVGASAPARAASEARGGSLRMKKTGVEISAQAESSKKPSKRRSKKA